MARRERHAVINDTTKEVVNVVVYDPQAQWSPPDGHSHRRGDFANRNSDKWDGIKFGPIRPLPDVPLPVPPLRVAAKTRRKKAR